MHHLLRVVLNKTALNFKLLLFNLPDLLLDDLEDRAPQGITRKPFLVNIALHVQLSYNVNHGFLKKDRRSNACCHKRPTLRFSSYVGPKSISKTEEVAFEDDMKSIDGIEVFSSQQYGDGIGDAAYTSTRLVICKIGVVVVKAFKEVIVNFMILISSLCDIVIQIDMFL